jgi:hypothetical protein
MEPIQSGWTSVVGQFLRPPGTKVKRTVVYDSEVAPLLNNIEGCRPGFNAAVLSANTVWVNYVTALDAPFSTEGQVHYSFDELVKMKEEHKYKYLESSIPDFDQTKVLLNDLFWLSYYIEQLDENRKEGKVPLITFQVHQLPSETDKLNLLKRYLPRYYPNFKCEDSADEMYKNVTINTEKGEIQIHMKYGYDLDSDLENDLYEATEIPFPGSDVYISSSMGVGYDPSIRPGDIVYPFAYEYLDINNNVLREYPSYLADPAIKVRNDAVDQITKSHFKSRQSRIAPKWVNILQNVDPFQPEGEGVVTHKEIDPNLLEQRKFGPVAKISGLWNPVKGGDHPIQFWKESRKE